MEPECIWLDTMNRDTSISARSVAQKEEKNISQRRNMEGNLANSKQHKERKVKQCLDCPAFIPLGMKKRCSPCADKKRESYHRKAYYDR